MRLAPRRRDAGVNDPLSSPSVLHAPLSQSLFLPVSVSVSVSSPLSFAYFSHLFHNRNPFSSDSTAPEYAALILCFTSVYSSDFWIGMWGQRRERKGLQHSTRISTTALHTEGAVTAPSFRKRLASLRLKEHSARHAHEKRCTHSRHRRARFGTRAHTHTDYCTTKAEQATDGEVRTRQCHERFNYRWGYSESGKKERERVDSNSDKDHHR